MPPDDAPDDATLISDSPAVALPKASPMPSINTLSQMVANPNIPGELMAASQKELKSMTALTATIRAARQREAKVMDQVLQNEAEDIKAHGALGINNAYDANKMMEVVGPEQTQIYLDKRNAYQAYYDTTANWTPDTPYGLMVEEIEKKLNPMHAPVNSPAMKTFQKMYEDAYKKALEMDNVRKRTQNNTMDETGRLAEAMMLPDSTRPKNIPLMTPEWLQENAHNLKGEQIDKVNKWLIRGPEYSDARSRDELTNDALYMDPQAFRAKLFDYHIGKRISPTDEDHLMRLNNEAQNDAGVKFIKEAMDSKLLGGSHYMQTALNSLREKTIQLYLAQKASHPEWKDSDRLASAMQLERDNRLFDTESVNISLTVTPAMRAVGITSRDQMEKDPQGNLLKIWGYMNQRRQSGQLSPAEAKSEEQNYLTWQGYFQYVDKNAKAIKEAQDKAKAGRK